MTESGDSAPAEGPAGVAAIPVWARWVIGLLAVGVLGLVVLSRDDDVSTSAGTTTSAETSAPTSEPQPTEVDAPPVTAPGTGSVPLSVPPSRLGTAPVSVPASSAGTAQLVDVRVRSEQGYDRVVFEFTGPRPSYEVRYADLPLTEDGSGAPVSVGSPHVLSVRMTPASAVVLGPDGYTKTYTGPDRLPGTGLQITEVVEVGDFEGQSTWAIGLANRVDFRVGTLDSPSRIVVDVPNT